MEAEVVLECWIDAVQHLDVCAGGEEFVTYSGEQDHVDVVVHARLKDGVIELPVHLIGVSICRWIVHLNDRDAGIVTVIDQSLLRFSGSSCHVLLPSSSLLVSIPNSCLLFCAHLWHR